MKAVARPRIRLGEYSATYEKHVGEAAPSPIPAIKRPKASQSGSGAKAAAIVRQAVEQDAELIDPLAPQTVGELALANRAEE